MALSFPPSPAIGDIFLNWQWNGSAWGPIPGGSSGGSVSITAGAGITVTPSPLTGTGTVALSTPVAISAGGTGATDPVQALQNLNGLSLAGGTATGGIRAPNLTVQDAGGTAHIYTTAGWIGYYNHDGNRVGYIGNSDTDMQIVCELAGSTFHVQGRATFGGNSLLIHGTRPVLGLWDEGAGLYGIWSDANQLRIGQIDGNVTPQGALVTVDGTGVMTATAPALADNSNTLVTSSWVKGQGYAPLASPTFTGTPSLPTGTTAVTQAAATNNTSLATTAYVQSQFPLTVAKGGTGSTNISMPVLTGFTLTNTLLVGNGTAVLTGSPWGTWGDTSLVGIGYGTNNNPYIEAFAARGTSGAPSAVQSGDSLLQMGGRGYGTSAWASGWRYSMIVRAAETWTGTAQGTQFLWRTTPIGGIATADAMTLDGSGNLTITGIATANGNQVIIRGTQPALSLIDTDVSNSTAVWNNGGQIIFGAGNGAGIPSATWGYFNSSGLTVTGSITANAGAAIPSASITAASGTDAMLQLTVTGLRTWSIGVQPNAPAGAIYFWDNSASATRLRIDAAGACSASSTWAVISDARLKDDVQPYTRGLAEILPLEPIMFRWTGSGGVPADGELHYGLAAQQIEEHLPELIREHAYVPPEGAREGDAAMVLKTYSPTDLTFALINACKELHERLTAAEAKLTSQSLARR